MGINQVREFHERHGCACDLTLDRMLNKSDDETMMSLYQRLDTLAQDIKDQGLDSESLGDPRLYRAHLMTEELSEAVLALAQRDEVALADATGDLRYVTWGTDLTFGIESGLVDREIHRSNMSKSNRKADDLRMRDKGPDFSPPNIAVAIAAGRGVVKGGDGS